MGLVSLQRHQAHDHERRTRGLPADGGGLAEVAARLERADDEMGHVGAGDLGQAGRRVAVAHPVLAAARVVDQAGGPDQRPVQARCPGSPAPSRGHRRTAWRRWPGRIIFTSGARLRVLADEGPGRGDHDQPPRPGLGHGRRSRSPPRSPAGRGAFGAPRAERGQHGVRAGHRVRHRRRVGGVPHGDGDPRAAWHGPRGARQHLHRVPGVHRPGEQPPADPAGGPEDREPQRPAAASYPSVQAAAVMTSLLPRRRGPAAGPPPGRPRQPAAVPRPRAAAASAGS